MKIKGGVGEIFIPIVEAIRTTEPNIRNTFDGHPLGGSRARCIDKEKKERKFRGKT